MHAWNKKKERLCFRPKKGTKRGEMHAFEATHLSFTQMHAAVFVGKEKSIGKMRFALHNDAQQFVKEWNAFDCI